MQPRYICATTTQKKMQEDSWILEKADVLLNNNIDEVWEITRAVIEKGSLRMKLLPTLLPVHWKIS